MHEATQLYHGLLEEADLPAQVVLAEITAPAPDTGTRAGPSLSDCLQDPYQLLHRMSELTPDLHKDLRVPASVLHQNLALGIVAPYVTRALLTGEGTLPDPERIFLQEPAQSLQWFDNGETPEPMPLDTWVNALAAQLESWFGLFRLALGVSDGAFWSSTGLALSAPYSRLYDRAPRQPLCEQANRWLKDFPCQARRFIDWVPATLETPEGSMECALPQRRGCCQKYRLPDGEYCGTCGIYREERLSAG